MKEYVCGGRVEANNPTEAIGQAMFSNTMELDTITCIETPGVGIGIVMAIFFITLISGTALGYLAGKK